MMYSDRELSQKLERTEARANAAFVESRAALVPDIGAEWIEVAGAYALFDGPSSPVTQTFGLGLFEAATGETLDTIEAFFRRHNAPVFHEVSPLADAGLLRLLGDRNYLPCELTSVMVRKIEHGMPPNPKLSRDVTTRVIGPGESELWAQTSVAGWATEGEGFAAFMLDLGRICTNARGGFPFLAELNGRAISAGMLYVFDDVAILAGATTVPEGRRRGGQLALLDARLRLAAERGCRIAMMAALPGSQSQRNAETNGFRVAYTRTKWQRHS